MNTRFSGLTMKMCLCAAMLALCGLLLHDRAAAAETDDVIEHHAEGIIDWSKGVLTAGGLAAPPQKNEAKTAEELLNAQENARGLARENMLNLVLKTRVDSRRTVGGLVAGSDLMMVKLATVMKALKATRQQYLSDGTVEITMQMNMYGGFAQLVLPEEIKQIEPIKTVGNGNEKAVTVLQNEDHGGQTRTYSGLVVDARGIRFSPAMAPVIVDEKGREVYGSAFVSREFAVQQGMCGYTRDVKAAERDPRVLARPLVVKGLQTAEGMASTIVISNADASKIKGASEHLSFLKKCRVVIVVD